MKCPEHPATIDIVSVNNAVVTVNGASRNPEMGFHKNCIPIEIPVKIILTVAFPLHDRIRNTGSFNLQPANPVRICYLCGKDGRNGILIPLLLNFLQLVKTIFLLFVILIIAVCKIPCYCKYQQKKDTLYRISLYPP